MNISRRVFLSFLLVPPRQTTSISAAVLEVFNDGNAGIAALVHHENPSMRNRFAGWLQAHPKSVVLVRNAAGEKVPGRMFRVRMCFGRGLIVLEKPMRIRERDVLIIADWN
jgi:hypothetical protein